MARFRRYAFSMLTTQLMPNLSVSQPLLGQRLLDLAVWVEQRVFTVTSGKVVEIELFADPQRLSQLDLVVLNA